MNWRPDRNCDLCGRTYTYSDRAWRCVCGGTLSIHDFGNADRVHLGEGATPLIRLPGFAGDVWAKLEFLAPTGSFKDRGAATMIARLKDIGVQEVADDSAGNAGVSIAAYCAAAGLTCRIYVARSANLARIGAIRFYGAAVTVVDGERPAATRAALGCGAYYAGHAWDPFFIEGLCPLAHEIAAAPVSRIFLPLGQGTLLLGLLKGFEQLVAAGRLAAVPLLIAVQTDACAPIAEMARAGLDQLPALERPARIFADGIAVAAPVRWRSLLGVIRRGAARIIAARDASLPDAVRALGRAGLFVEPTSAVVLDAMLQLDAVETPPPGRTLLLLTASGLKTPAAMDAMLAPEVA